MKRLLHLFLALSFALLQSIAPLAHAHTDGYAPQGVHLPEAQQAHFSHSNLPVCCAAEAEESPAIVVEQGFERDDDSVAPACQMVSAPPAPQIAATSESPVFLTARLSFILPSASFPKPYPQAPPARISL